MVFNNKPGSKAKNNKNRTVPFLPFQIISSDSPDNIFFPNGWIGERLAEQWLQSKGYRVERAIPQRRGTENGTSSGDIDLVAKKRSKVLYVEVKFWAKKSALTPSWLVEFMLERKKLNTLFEQHRKGQKRKKGDGSI